MNNGSNPQIFRSPAKWRQWLKTNHDKKDFLWLALKKKKSEKKGINYQQALDEALCFGWIDGTVKSLDSDYFMQRFTPRRKGSIWSLVNKNKVLKLIEEGRMTEAGLEKINEAKANGKWQTAYSTPVKLVLPDDVVAALKNTRGAIEAFSSYAPSHQNMYLHWVNDAKKEETRKRRIAKLIERILQKKLPGEL